MKSVGSTPAVGSSRRPGVISVRYRMGPIVGLLLALFFTGIPAPSPAAAVQASGQRKLPGALVAGVTVGPTTRDPLTTGEHSYWGSLQLRAAGDGLVVVNRLPLERYLLGLQEVPLTWPVEALKAQAIAARTYALNTLSRPRAGAAATYGFDICASIECQVYSGADVLGSLGGERWLQAVRETARRTITYEGEPILARYHSTSGGTTFDNEQIFTSDPAYPYLQGVGSTAEQGSPLYRWRVAFPLRHVQAMLKSAGWWTSEGRLIQVRSIASSAGRHYPDLVFRGRAGRLVRSAEEFREIARSFAPSMWPKRYPSEWSTQSGRLPETLPSNRVAVLTKGRKVVVHGRGWGHGVGMSQWGAEGLARRGDSFEEILNHYYTGVEIDDYQGPGRISVGLDWGESRVGVSGAFKVVDGRGRTIIAEALGKWTFIYSGTGAVAIDPPRGFGLPLRVGIVDAPASVAPGAVTTVTVALSRPAHVRATTDGSGKGRAAVAEAGRHDVEWLAPEEPGSYSVRVEASAGSAERLSEVVEIAVIEPSLDAGTRPGGSGSDTEPSERSADRTWIYVVVPLLALIALVGKRLAGRIGR